MNIKTLFSNNYLRLLLIILIIYIYFLGVDLWCSSNFRLSGDTGYIVPWYFIPIRYGMPLILSLITIICILTGFIKNEIKAIKFGIVLLICTYGLGLFSSLLYYSNLFEPPTPEERISKHLIIGFSILGSITFSLISQKINSAKKNIILIIFILILGISSTTLYIKYYSPGQGGFSVLEGLPIKDINELDKVRSYTNTGSIIFSMYPYSYYVWQFAGRFVGNLNDPYPFNAISAEYIKTGEYELFFDLLQQNIFRKMGQNGNLYYLLVNDLPNRGVPPDATIFNELEPLFPVVYSGNKYTLLSIYNYSYPSINANLSILKPQNYELDKSRVTLIYDDENVWDPVGIGSGGIGEPNIYPEYSIKISGNSSIKLNTNQGNSYWSGIRVSYKQYKDWSNLDSLNVNLYGIGNSGTIRVLIRESGDMLSGRYYDILDDWTGWKQFTISIKRMNTFSYGQTSPSLSHVYAFEITYNTQGTRYVDDVYITLGGIDDYNQILTAVSLAKLNYSVVDPNDYYLFDNTNKILVLPSDLPLGNFTKSIYQWVNEGGKIVVFNGDGSSGHKYFAQRLSLSFNDSVENWVDEIKSNNSSIKIPTLKVPSFYSSDKNVTSTTFYQSDSIKIPFSFTKRIGYGTMVYVEIYPYYSLQKGVNASTIYSNLKNIILIALEPYLNQLIYKHDLATEKERFYFTNNFIDNATITPSSFYIPNISNYDIVNVSSSNFLDKSLSNFSQKIKINQISVYGSVKTIFSASEANFVLDKFGRYTKVTFSNGFKVSMSAIDQYSKISINYSDNNKKTIFNTSEIILVFDANKEADVIMTSIDVQSSNVCHFENIFTDWTYGLGYFASKMDIKDGVQFHIDGSDEKRIFASNLRINGSFIRDNNVSVDRSIKSFFEVNFPINLLFNSPYFMILNFICILLIILLIFFFKEKIFKFKNNERNLYIPFFYGD